VCPCRFNYFRKIIPTRKFPKCSTFPSAQSCRAFRGRRNCYANRSPQNSSAPSAKLFPSTRRRKEIENTVNNHEAKLILQAYRPGGEDASDPLFAEALEQARRDPELQKMACRNKTALEARLQARLQTAIPVPARIEIRPARACGKFHAPAPWWFQPVKLAAAAGGNVAAGVGCLFSCFHIRRRNLLSFRETMARYSAQEQGQHCLRVPRFGGYPAMAPRPGHGNQF